MNDEITPYRTAAPPRGDFSAVVTLSTLVALLAMAVVFDAAGGQSPLRGDSYSFTVDSAKRCDETESLVESSLTGRLVRAARDFLGTGVPASSAWHFASSCFAIEDFTKSTCPVRDSLSFQDCHEVTLAHLLNIPPPATI